MCGWLNEKLLLSGCFVLLSVFIIMCMFFGVLMWVV